MNDALDLFDPLWPHSWYCAKIRVTGGHQAGKGSELIGEPASQVGANAREAFEDER